MVRLHHQGVFWVPKVKPLQILQGFAASPLTTCRDETDGNSFGPQVLEKLAHPLDGPRVLGRFIPLAFFNILKNRLVNVKHGCWFFDSLLEQSIYITFKLAKGRRNGRVGFYIQL